MQSRIIHKGRVICVFLIFVVSLSVIYRPTWLSSQPQILSTSEPDPSSPKFPFSSALLVGFKFRDPENPLSGHDWALGFPIYIAKYVPEVHVLHITKSVEPPLLRLSRIEKNVVVRTDIPEFLEILKKTPVDLLIFRQVTLVDIVKDYAPEILYNSRYSALIPILPGSRSTWDQQQVKSRYPWFNVYIPDVAFLKPPHPESMWPERAEVALHTPKKLLVYVGSVSDRKGQLDFARVLPREYPAKILFLGEVRDQLIANKTMDILREKKVKAEFVGYLEWESLISYYKKADALVLFSRSDPSPRVVFEGLVHNLPFLISSTVTLPPALLDPKLRLGQVCDVTKILESEEKEEEEEEEEEKSVSDEKQRVQKQLLEFLEVDHGYSAYNFAQENLSEEVAYGTLLQDLTGEYTKDVSRIHVLPIHPLPS